MDIRCILFDEQQVEQLIQSDWLPDMIVSKIESCVVFGGLDDEEEIVSIAVFYFAPHTKDSVRLEYIYVTEEYEGQNAKEDLIRKCEEVLAQQGYKPDADPMYLRIYRHWQFDGSHFLNIVNKQPNVCEQVIKIDDYHDWRLTRFIGQYRGAGLHISEKEYIPGLCRFFTEDGKIKAALCLCISKDNSIMNLSPFLAPDIKNPNAIIYMASVLYSEIMDILDPDTEIHLYFTHKNVFDGYRDYIMGEAEEYVLPCYTRTGR